MLLRQHFEVLFVLAFDFPFYILQCNNQFVWLIDYKERNMKNKEPNFKEFRKRHELTRMEATKVMNVSLSCVESWEQKRRNLSGSALQLIQIIDRNPKIINDLID
tara:strand:- start:148 stop:462 length:315 start_codon:yes stop_codon:yes gene_type:complete